jgi:hypothetical protein
MSNEVAQAGANAVTAPAWPTSLGMGPSWGCDAPSTTVTVYNMNAVTARAAHR